MELEDRIWFYDQKSNFGYLSNFAKTPILIDGQTYATVEHYFQSQKFLDPVYAREVAAAPTPAAAARLGRSRARPLRADWESAKVGVMARALLAKFSQHPELAKRLKLTAPKLLIEHTAKDRYWADGGDGSGKNMLGLLLMRVRDSLVASA